jgi:hypothetical protein
MQRLVFLFVIFVGATACNGSSSADLAARDQSASVNDAGVDHATPAGDSAIERD